MGVASQVLNNEIDIKSEVDVIIKKAGLQLDNLNIGFILWGKAYYAFKKAFSTPQSIFPIKTCPTHSLPFKKGSIAATDLDKAKGNIEKWGFQLENLKKQLETLPNVVVCSQFTGGDKPGWTHGTDWKNANITYDIGTNGQKPFKNTGDKLVAWSDDFYVGNGNGLAKIDTKFAEFQEEWQDNRIEQQQN
jgi:hypothetical protein